MGYQRKYGGELKFGSDDQEHYPPLVARRASELLREFGEYRFIGFGVVLLVVVLFMPKGIYPRLESLWDHVVIQRAWLKRRQK